MELHITKNTDKKKSLRFYLSIMFSIIAIGLITFIILSFPLLPYYGSESAYIGIDNFFFKIKYHYNFYYGYQLTGIYPNAGTILFFTIGVILLLISGSTILVEEYTESKILMIINSILYIIPAVAGLVRFQLIINANKDVLWYSITLSDGAQYTWPLGFFPLSLYFWFYITLLYNKQSVYEWSGFFSKKYPADYPEAYFKPKRINTIIYLIWFILRTIALILSVFGFYIGLSDPFALRIFILYPFQLLYTLWFIFSELVFRRMSEEKIAKKFVINDLLKGEFNLAVLAERYYQSLDKIEKYITEAIRSGVLTGSITKDGYYHTEETKLELNK